MSYQTTSTSNFDARQTFGIEGSGSEGEREKCEGRSEEDNFITHMCGLCCNVKKNWIARIGMESSTKTQRGELPKLICAACIV